MSKFMAIRDGDQRREPVCGHYDVAITLDAKNSDGLPVLILVRKGEGTIKWKASMAIRRR